MNEGRLEGHGATAAAPPGTPRSAGSLRLPEAPGPTTVEARAVPPLELEIVTDRDAVEALRPAWRELAEAAAATPFQHPDWLVPWFEAYGAPDTPLVLAWRRGGDLVGLVPLLATGGRAWFSPGAELLLWGGRGPLLRGFVDLLAAEGERPAVEAAFLDWLAGAEPDWRLLHLLRLPPGSTTDPAIRRAAAAEGWRVVELTGVVRSTTYVIDLPADTDGWQRWLGPKARHNMRREVRLFGKRRGGRYERWTDPAVTDAVVDALRRFMGERWGAAEGYFRVDPRFDGFLRTALRALLARNVAYVDVAVEPAALAGLLVTFVVGRAATAVLIGLRGDPELAPLSIGKNLFDASIGEAVRRGATTYDFLWVGGYKEAFWHARPRRTTSLVVGRGRLGRLLGRSIELRRVLLPRLFGLGRRLEEKRPVSAEPVDRGGSGGPEATEEDERDRP
ncbi:MAG TPA: GNAT family N-acetyltransferase [Candidatus Binatia bacterium]|nr:GNAT family N-acetyltransferase [Candidatus Binatia bacterium]